jgi:hypothetical protein
MLHPRLQIVMSAMSGSFGPKIGTLLFNERPVDFFLIALAAENLITTMTTRVRAKFAVWIAFLLHD